jgi:hypothetical protein
MSLNATGVFPTCGGAATDRHTPHPEETPSMARRYGPHFSLLGLIYIIIGVFIAWDRGYIDEGLVERIVSALLAIFLWVLVLLGVDFHINF